MTQKQTAIHDALKIRPATVADAALIRRFIGALATFEKEPDAVKTTESDIARDGFGAPSEFRALIAEWDGKPVGFALFFPYYSTWRGRGFFLEDVFIEPEFRGRGIGQALFARVAKIARQEGRRFMKWSVLAWNKNAVEMYARLGGEFLDGWRDVFLHEDALAKLAEEDS
jgi:GNAT superfamily N-acetyltransferase